MEQMGNWCVVLNMIYSKWEIFSLQEISSWSWNSCTQQQQQTSVAILTLVLYIKRQPVCLFGKCTDAFKVGKTFFLCLVNWHKQVDSNSFFPASGSMFPSKPSETASLTPRTVPVSFGSCRSQQVQGKNIQYRILSS